jgi:Xaa-Pro aminopeptidase
MNKTNRSENLLIIASSEADANQYYATRFLAPDPFVFFQIRGKKYALLSDLEIDRARKESLIDRPLSTAALVRQYEAAHGKKPGQLDLVLAFVRQRQIRTVSVPGNFPTEYTDTLRRRGLRVIPKPEPFFVKRPVKSREEIAAIIGSLRTVERAARLAIETLRKTVIKKGMLYDRGRVLTSERLKKMIRMNLLEGDCMTHHLIAACGKDTVDPHQEGKGPLYAHRPIILDIFPQHAETRYFADFTRTVVRGKASSKLKKMYTAVKSAQELAFGSIRNGTDGNKIYQSVRDHFTRLGFETGVINGRRQGFFHGLGHGLGLEIHEAPGMSLRAETLRTGNVITVEPGLYYEDAGGVRLEDVVVVTKTGCRNLTRFPKVLEI